MVDLSIIILLAFAPGIFWLWYFYKRDKYEPEPKFLIILMFFLGMLTVILARILEIVAGIFIPSEILAVILIAPVIEELVKFSAVRGTIYNSKEFDEPMDGIVYAAAVALGFASVENVLYLLTASSNGSLASTFFIRGLLTVPGHVLFSSMWGFALGMAKFSKKNRRKEIITGGIILSIIAHGAFNFTIVLNFIPEMGGILIIIVAIVLWSTINEKIRKAHKRGKKLRK